MSPHEDAFQPQNSSPLGTEVSDSALVALARSGDEGAFQQLFRRHYPAVRGLAARLLLDIARLARSEAVPR